jgi:hypothetical protein
MNFIDKVGIEMEGGWDWPQWKDVPIIQDESIQQAPVRWGTNFITRHRGEVASPPLDPSEILPWLTEHYPEGGNDWCAMHVHFSVKNFSMYGELATLPFYKQFLSDMKLFGQAWVPDPKHQFWNRLAGNNKYCRKDFKAITQMFRHVKHPHPEDHARRCILNYCWRLHRTIECRLFPMFQHVKVSHAAIMAVLNSAENYLSKASLEVKPLQGRIILDHPVVVRKLHHRVKVNPSPEL